MSGLASPLPGAMTTPADAKWRTLATGLILSIALHASAAAAFLGWAVFTKPSVPFAIEVTVVPALPGDMAGGEGETEERSAPKPLPSPSRANPHPAEIDLPTSTHKLETAMPEATAVAPAPERLTPAAPAQRPILKPIERSPVPLAPPIDEMANAPLTAANSARIAPEQGSARTSQATGEATGDRTGAGNNRDARPAAGNPVPEYPRLARRRGFEGDVVLRVEVGADGRPLSVAVAESSGHDILDDAARAAVDRWRFLPAERSGGTIASTVMVPITFRLEK